MSKPRIKVDPMLSKVVRVYSVYVGGRQVIGSSATMPADAWSWYSMAQLRTPEGMQLRAPD